MPPERPAVRREALEKAGVGFVVEVKNRAVGLVKFEDGLAFPLNFDRARA